MLPSWSWPSHPPSCRRLRKILWLALPLVVAAVPVYCALAQELHKSIGEIEGKAVTSVSRVLSSANPALATNIFQKVGYAPENFPPGWAQFPMVRKIETVYLAAEQHTARQGSSVLAIMSQSLAQQYPSVADDPGIKPFLAAAVPAGKPQYTNLVQAAKPDPVVQRAILAISRYTEGREVSVATILQFHFNLPPEIAYDILRTSASNTEALSRGLSRVPEDQRTASLQRVVAHLDDTYKSTATQERDLDPYRATSTAHPALLASVRDEHATGARTPSIGPNNHRRGQSDIKHGPADVPPPPTGSGPGSAAGPPPIGGGGIGGGTGGSPTGVNQLVRGESLVDTDAGIGSSGGMPSIEPQMRPQDAYVERVPEWYGSAPVEFAEMVAVEGGAGGVVFGNKFQSRISKVLIDVEYLPLSDRQGQLLFHFADKTEASYGPVRSDDVYAAYSMIYSNGKEFPAFQEGAGLPLLGIEEKETHYDIVDDSVQKDGMRWNVVAHPSLAHVELGRSVLMADVLPIGNENSRPSLEELMHQAGLSDLDGIYKAMPTDVTNWKFTDAPLTFTLEGDQIVARNTLQLGGVNCFITAQEFRNGKVNFDSTLVDRFNKFAPRLTAISEDYKRLSDFVPIFDLFRWAKSQKVAVLQNAPAPPDPSKQSIPTWVVLDKAGIEFLFDDNMQTPLEVLQSKIEVLLKELHQNVSAAMAAGIIGIEHKWLAPLAAEESIEREEIRYRQADNAFYRLHEQLLSALASLPSSKSDEIEASTDRLEETLYRAARSNSTVEIQKEKKNYHDEDEALIGLEASVLPSQKDQITQMRYLAESHAWNMISLMADREKGSLEEADILDLYKDLLPILPPEIRSNVEVQNSNLAAKVDAFSQTKLKYERAMDDLDDLDEAVEHHFEHAAPSTKSRFETVAADPDSQEFDKFLTTSAPALAASRRKVVATVKRLESQLSQEAKDAEQSEADLEQEVVSVFPTFSRWAKLLISLQDLRS